MSKQQGQAMLLMLKGAISEGPSGEQAKVQAAAEALREVVKAHGDHGMIALSLVSLEKSVEVS